MSVFNELLATADHPAQATAGTDENFVLGEMPFDATMTEIGIIPDAALVGDPTNNRVFTVFNRGQAGIGTTQVATLTTTVTWVLRDKVLLTLGTGANIQVAAADVLEVVETHGGTGVAHPQLVVEARGTHR